METKIICYEKVISCSTIYFIIKHGDGTGFTA